MHDLIDGAIVLVAVTSAALVMFTLPTTEVVGFSVFAVVQGAYPVVDSVVIFLAILLSWTSASRVASFWLLGISIAFILVGDIGYAWIGTEGRTVGSPPLDLPFVIAFMLFGAAASAVQQRPVAAWYRGRIGLLLPMLLVPLAVAVSTPDMASTWIGAGASAVATVLLVVRAVTAVRAHATAQAHLRHQATHDQLTGLVNRSGLLPLVDDLLATARRAATRWISSDRRPARAVSAGTRRPAHHPPAEQGWDIGVRTLWLALFARGCQAAHTRHRTGE